MGNTLFHSKFKVGDRVKVTEHPCRDLINTVITLREQFMYDESAFSAKSRYPTDNNYWLAEEWVDLLEFTFLDNCLEAVEQ